MSGHDPATPAGSPGRRRLRDWGSTAILGVLLLLLLGHMHDVLIRSVLLVRSYVQAPPPSPTAPPTAPAPEARLPLPRANRWVILPWTGLGVRWKQPRRSCGMVDGDLRWPPTPRKEVQRCRSQRS